MTSSFTSYVRSRRADHLFLLVDVRRGLQAEQEQLIEFLESEGYGRDRVTLVATKADKSTGGEARKAVERVRANTKLKVVLSSADTRLGREEVWRRLVSGEMLSSPAEALKAESSEMV